MVFDGCLKRRSLIWLLGWYYSDLLWQIRESWWWYYTIRPDTLWLRYTQSILTSSLSILLLFTSFKFHLNLFHSWSLCIPIWLLTSAAFFLLAVRVYSIQFFHFFYIAAVKWSLTSTKVALFFCIILWAIVDVRILTLSGPVFTHQKTLQMFIAAVAAVTAALHPKSANNTLETVLFQDYRYHFNEYIFTLAICVYKTATQNCY